MPAQQILMLPISQARRQLIKFRQKVFSNAFFKQLYFFLSKYFHPVFCVCIVNQHVICALFYLIPSNLFISTYFVHLFSSIETSILTFIYRISNTTILYFLFKYVFYCSNKIEMRCSIFSSNIIDSFSVYEKYIIFFCTKNR